MILKAFSIFDSKVKAYATPFFLHARGEAIRAISEEANNPNSRLCKYAEDFTLFEIGEFDCMTAKFTSYNTPESLGVAVQFREVPRV